MRHLKRVSHLPIYALLGALLMTLLVILACGGDDATTRGPTAAPTPAPAPATAPTRPGANRHALNPHRHALNPRDDGHPAGHPKSHPSTNPHRGPHPGPNPRGYGQGPRVPPSGSFHSPAGPPGHHGPPDLPLLLRPHQNHV